MSIGNAPGFGALLAWLLICEVLTNSAGVVEVVAIGRPIVVWERANSFPGATSAAGTFALAKATARAAGSLPASMLGTRYGTWASRRYISSELRYRPIGSPDNALASSSLRCSCDKLIADGCAVRNSLAGCMEPGG
ncbi:hypothetical protein BX667DRAFT_494489 [Coemansia mojavensis]|nr:hypothetical protein BX667DRAFT_494489 [Coemansia mojavensis]